MLDVMVKQTARKANGVAGGDGSPRSEPYRDAYALRTPPLTKAEVAELSMAVIRRMTCDELMELIRAADVPLFRQSVLGHLGYYDRGTLERLAFLARRTVRNQRY